MEYFFIIVAGLPFILTLYPMVLGSYSRPPCIALGELDIFYFYWTFLIEDPQIYSVSRTVP
jgi:hypothetical protein